MKREISIVLKVENLEKARQQIANVIPNKAVRNTDKLTKATKGSTNALRRQGVSASRTKTRIDTYVRTIFRSVAILGLFTRGVRASFDAFEAGAGLERMTLQFSKFVGEYGVSIESLRASTRGAVEDFKLMKTSVRAVREGLQAGQLVSVFKMATVASRQLGMTTEETINTITKAITRQDESALTTLTTILKTNKSFQQQLAVISKMGGPVSSVMKIQARQDLIMAALNGKFGNFNALVSDSSEILDKFRTALTNLKAGTGSVIAVALSPLLRVLTGVAKGTSNLFTALMQKESFKSFVKNMGTVIIVVGAATAAYAAFSLAASIGLGALMGPLAAIVAVGFAAGVGMKALGLDIAAIIDKFSFLGTAIKVYFELLSSFDPKTGISQILKKDKEELGSVYNAIKLLAQVTLYTGAIIRGIFAGLSDVFSPIATTIGKVSDLIFRLLGGIENKGPLAASAIQGLEISIRGFVTSLFDAIPLLGTILKMFSLIDVVIDKLGIATTSRKYYGELPSPEVTREEESTPQIDIPQGFRETPLAKSLSRIGTSVMPDEEEVSVTSPSLTPMDNEELKVSLKKMNEHLEAIRGSSQSLKDNEDRKRVEKTTEVVEQGISGTFSGSLISE